MLSFRLFVCHYDPNQFCCLQRFVHSVFFRLGQLYSIKNGNNVLTLAPHEVPYLFQGKYKLCVTFIDWLDTEAFKVSLNLIVVLIPLIKRLPFKIQFKRSCIIQTNFWNVNKIQFNMQIYIFLKIPG